MTNQSPEGRAPHDLDELETLPADLQPLYQQLSDDGAAWQAASAGKIAALAARATAACSMRRARHVWRCVRCGWTLGISARGYR